MNKHQRYRAAIKGEPVDHVPAGFWLHFPPEQHAGAAALAAHLDFYGATDVDLLKVMNERLFRRETPVSTPSDWKGWRPFGRDYFQAQIDLVKAVCDEIGNEVPVLATIHGTFISTFHASKRSEHTSQGPNAITAHLRTCPDEVVPALEIVSDSLIELAQACLEAGVAGIYYSAIGGESYRFEEEIFLRYVKPYDVNVLEAVSAAGTSVGSTSARTGFGCRFWQTTRRTP